MQYFGFVFNAIYRITPKYIPVMSHKKSKEYVLAASICSILHGEVYCKSFIFEDLFHGGAIFIRALDAANIKQVAWC